MSFVQKKNKKSGMRNKKACRARLMRQRSKLCSAKKAAIIEPQPPRPAIDTSTEMNREEVIESLSIHILATIMKNDRRNTNTTPSLFDSPTPTLTPSISAIRELITTIVTKRRLAAVSCVVSLVFIERSRIRMTARNWERLVMMSLLLANKEAEDVYSVWNVRFVGFIPGLQVYEINYLEMEFLQYIKYRLHVEHNHYMDYYQLLFSLLPERIPEAVEECEEECEEGAEEVEENEEGELEELPEVEEIEQDEEEEEEKEEEEEEEEELNEESEQGVVEEQEDDQEEEQEQDQEEWDQTENENESLSQEEVEETNVQEESDLEELEEVEEFEDVAEEDQQEDNDTQNDFEDTEIQEEDIQEEDEEEAIEEDEQQEEEQEDCQIDEEPCEENLQDDEEYEEEQPEQEDDYMSS
eukprot:TRINITY_DN166_c0_g1_i1.p1 TRINITY_DN166_c0_g1~~TRINITY_DN166_c0_g1_i1.p1  ORF type:complete len:411 (-),score=144.46 TRINITY_DN166_c0_g1_i1:146-1378(-)